MKTFNLSRIEPWMNFQESSLSSFDFEQIAQARKEIQSQLNKTKGKIPQHEKLYIYLSTSSRNLKEKLAKGKVDEGIEEYEFLSRELSKHKSKLTLREYGHYYFPTLVADFYRGNFETGLEKSKKFQKLCKDNRFKHFKNNSQMLDLMFLEKLGLQNERLKLAQSFQRIIKRNPFKMRCEENFANLQLSLNKNFQKEKEKRLAFLSALANSKLMSEESHIERSFHLPLYLGRYYELGAHQKTQSVDYPTRVTLETQ